MPINTQKVRVVNGKVVVEGEVERNRHAFSTVRKLPEGGVPVAPFTQRLLVSVAGDAMFMVSPAPHPEALKFVTVERVERDPLSGVNVTLSRRVYVEHDHFTVDGNGELAWKGPFLNPQDVVYFWCFGAEFAREIVRLDRIEVAHDDQREFSISGVAVGGRGEVIAAGLTYFSGDHFRISGDRLTWTDNSRLFKKGDVLHVLFFLQKNASNMFRHHGEFQVMGTEGGKFTLPIMPADNRGVRVYLNREMCHQALPGRLPQHSVPAEYVVNGRTLQWVSSARPLKRGDRLKVIIPAASIVTEDVPEVGGGSENELNTNYPEVTIPGQTVIPIPNPPSVLDKSILIVGGLAYVQGHGYDLDSLGRIIWDGVPALTSRDRLQLIGFNSRAVADGTIMERLTVADGEPSLLTHEPVDPSKVILIVSSGESYGGLALMPQGHFSLDVDPLTGKRRKIRWGGERIDFALKDTDTLIAIYYKDLSVSLSAIVDRRILAEDDIVRRSYDLGIVPSEPQRSIWTINGVVMVFGEDYLISGSTLWYIGNRLALRPGDEVALITR